MHLQSLELLRPTVKDKMYLQENSFFYLDIKANMKFGSHQKTCIIVTASTSANRQAAANKPAILASIFVSLRWNIFKFGHKFYQIKHI